MNNIDIDLAASSAYDLGCQFVEIVGPIKAASQVVVARAFFEYLTQEGDEPLVCRQTSLSIQMRALERDVGFYSTTKQTRDDHDRHMFSPPPVLHVADFIKKSFAHLAGIMKVQHPLSPEDMALDQPSAPKHFTPKVRL